MQYDSKRGIFIQHVISARKDNKVVKKGESYIRVKNSKYAVEELFRDEKELAEVYPNRFELTYEDIAYLISSYRNYKGKRSDFLEKAGFKK